MNLSLAEPGPHVSASVSTGEILDQIKRSGGFSLQFLRRSARAGIIDYGALLPLLHQVGEYDLGAGRLYEGHVNALFLLDLYADETVFESASACAADGDLFGVWATDEGPPVSAIVDEKTVELHGRKGFCSGARRVNQALITAAQADGTRLMVLVPMRLIDDDRVDDSHWSPLGMESSESLTVDFSNLRLPRTAIIGDADDYLREPWFNGGAMRFAAVQAGGAAGLARAMRTYLVGRDRHGDGFQRFRAGEVAIALTTNELWLAKAAMLFDRALRDAAVGEAPSHDCVVFAKMTRTIIEQNAQTVLRAVERSIGAQGLRESTPFAQRHRDLTMYLRQPAPDAVMTAVGEAYFQNALPPI